MRPQRETTDLEGVLVLGEGVGHGGGGGQHVPEVDGHAALPVQAGAHVHQALGGLPHLGRGVNERQIGRRWGGGAPHALPVQPRPLDGGPNVAAATRN